MLPIRSTQPLTARQRPALSPVLLLVVALLWAQLLGLAHRVLHSPQAGAVSVVAQAAHGHAAHASGLLAHLLAPADDASDCRLYDQLGHADALPAVPLLALALPLPLFLSQTVLAGLFLPAPAPFEARAPPLVR
jgi:hypothetical protein